ncbi:MAG: hypothetical protein ACP5FT_02870 [Acidilobus sp.]
MAISCSPKRDFLRHIAMPRIAEALVSVDLGKAVEVKNTGTYDVKQLNARIAGILNDIKKRLASAEVSYSFSIYNGRPERLAQYLSSPEWDELMRYVISELKDAPQALEFVVGVIKDILNLTKQGYKDACGLVSEAADKALLRIDEMLKSTSKQATENANRDYVESNVSPKG